MKLVERRTSWAIESSEDWVVPTDYFASPPAVERNRDGLRSLLFATRREARDMLPRARRTLTNPRAVKVTITVTT